MKKIQEMNDVASEVLMILNYFNNDMLERIPTEFLEELEEQASTSTYNVEIDSTKNRRGGVTSLGVFSALFLKNENKAVDKNKLLIYN